jgi:hypothetical protein
MDNLDEKKLIALALENLPEKYVNAFSTLSMNGNVDLEKFEAIYRAHQGKLKSDEEDKNKVNLVTVYNKKRKNYKWKKKDGEIDNKDEKCKHCGRTGHNPDKSWMLDKNREKHPEWFDPEKYSPYRLFFSSRHLPSGLGLKISE